MLASSFLVRVVNGSTSCILKKFTAWVRFDDHEISVLFAVLNDCPSSPHPQRGISKHVFCPYQLCFWAFRVRASNMGVGEGADLTIALPPHLCVVRFVCLGPGKAMCCRQKKGLWDL